MNKSRELRLFLARSKPTFPLSAAWIPTIFPLEEILKQWKITCDRPENCHLHGFIKREKMKPLINQSIKRLTEHGCRTNQSDQSINQSTNRRHEFWTSKSINQSIDRRQTAQKLNLTFFAPRKKWKGKYNVSTHRMSALKHRLPSSSQSFCSAIE